MASLWWAASGYELPAPGGSTVCTLATKHLFLRISGQFPGGTVPRPTDTANIVVKLPHTGRCTGKANGRRRTEIERTLGYLELIISTPDRSIHGFRIEVEVPVASIGDIDCVARVNNPWGGAGIFCNRDVPEGSTHEGSCTSSSTRFHS